MGYATEIYRTALENTAKAFSLPVSLVETIADAYYDQKELDAGAQIVLARYQKELSDFIGPIVAQWANEAAKRDRERHNAGNRGSRSSTKPTAKNRPNQSGNCGGGFCATG